MTFTHENTLNSYSDDELALINEAAEILIARWGGRDEDGNNEKNAADLVHNRFWPKCTLADLTREPGND